MDDLAPQLTGSLLTDALKAAWAMDDNLARARGAVVAEAVRAAWSGKADRPFGRRLSLLAELTRHLPARQRSAALANIMQAIGLSSGEYGGQAAAVIPLAACLPGELIGPALDNAQMTGTEWARAWALRTIAATLWQLDINKFPELKGEIRVFGMFDGLTRHYALWLLGEAADQIASLDGPEAVRECCRAVNQVGRRWP